MMDPKKTTYPGHEKSQKALKPLAVPGRRLVQPLVPSSRAVKH